MDYPTTNYQGLTRYPPDESVSLKKADDGTIQLQVQYNYKKMESEYNKSTETFGQKDGVNHASEKKKKYESEDELLERGHWTGKLDFILALIGFSVGFGNIWRFPYLCYKNGGGAFLIPYFICLGIGGIPLLVLEIGFGQYTSQGGVTSWNMVPVFKDSPAIETLHQENNGSKMERRMWVSVFDKHLNRAPFQEDYKDKTEVFDGKSLGVYNRCKNIVLQ